MNDKGSAITESLPAMAAVAAFVMGLLLAAYLIFSRAYIQYQSEQALYCLSEAKTEFFCRRRLEDKLRAGLPWGRLSKVHLRRAYRRQTETWTSEVEWNIQKFPLRVSKQLDTRRLVQNRALRW